MESSLKLQQDPMALSIRLNEVIVDGVGLELIWEKHRSPCGFFALTLRVNSPRSVRLAFSLQPF